jgi:hypothetical protein
MSSVPQRPNTGDRLYINNAKEIYAHAARTVDPIVGVQSPNAAATFIPRGIHVFLNVTAVAANPSIVLTIQGFQGLGLTFFYPQLISAPITTTGIYIFKVAPGITAVPDLSAADFLADFWAIEVVHANVDSITYGVTVKLFS